ncbi:hypothetical protein [Povalibacter sp.]|uniref:hypothetical protein n=1 Tax=Povalibacter sp. TaxID=1962978 RepID=UPI002F41EC9C
MSSHGSPTLVLELRRWPSEQVLTLGLLLAVGLAAALLFRSMNPLVLFLACAISLAGLAGAFRSAGWLGGAYSVTRVTWRADGVWRLTFAGGTELEGLLLPESRMSPAAIWLRWSLESPAPTDAGRRDRRCPRTRTLLVVPRDLSRADFRRLLVRLRLDRSECVPTATQANS